MASGVSSRKKDIKPFTYHIITISMSGGIVAILYKNKLDTVPAIMAAVDAYHAFVAREVGDTVLHPDDDYYLKPVAVGYHKWWRSKRKLSGDRRQGAGRKTI
jgi:hypothetical protein